MLYNARQKHGDKMKMTSVLGVLNISVFLKNHVFLLPVLYLFYTACGLSLGDFFLLQGLSALTCLLLDVPMGYLTDQVSKKKMMIFSGLLLVLRFALLLLWPTKIIVFIGEFLYALVIVSYVGTADSYIYELLKSKNKSIKMLKRYGRLYFWASIGTGISSLSGAYLYGMWGAQIVIALSLLFSMISVCLLFFLPDVKTSEVFDKPLLGRYTSLFKAIKQSVKKPKFLSLIGYSAFLTAAYQIFMWSMQPLMKMAHVPVALFGVVFFANHISRGFGSYMAHKMVSVMSLNTLGWITWGGFIISFGAAILITMGTDVFETLFLLGIMCVTIFAQVAYLIAVIAKIHDLSDSQNRATAASLNSMAGRLATALCLILSKFILDDFSMQTNLVLFMMLFIPSGIILWRFNKH